MRTSDAPRVSRDYFCVGIVWIIFAALAAMVFWRANGGMANLAPPAPATTSDQVLELSEVGNETGTPNHRFENGVFPVPGLGSGWLGTYVGGDGYRGTLVSSPFTLRYDIISIAVLGYPSSQGNRLTLEILDASGSVVHSLTFDGENPRESARNWTISTHTWVGNQARLRLMDGLDQAGGWLAVGAIRPVKGPVWLSGSTRHYGWFALATAAIAGLVFIPGLALRTWSSHFSREPALLPLPGLLLLSVTGLAVWLIGAAPLKILLTGILWNITFLAGWTALAWWKNGCPLRREDQEALGLYACLGLGSICFGILPLEVAQESHAHSILQARMIASPPDHFIPQRTAIYFLHGKDGRADRALYFGEWSAASRGPLVPLMIASVLATFDLHPGDPPRLPDDRWPVDSEGMFVARILGTLTNAMVVLGGGALAAQLWPRSRRLALVWLAVAPVTLINTDFLWPKLFATFFVLLAVLAIVKKNPVFLSALGCALAYFAHPIGALYTPAVALFLAHQILLRNPEALPAKISELSRTAAIFGLTLFAFLAPWLLFKSQLGQPDFFFRYPFGDGRGFIDAQTVGTWLQSRLSNLWFSLVPAAFFFSDQMSSWSAGPLSEPLRWAIGYAKSLPGNLGLAAFFIAIGALTRRSFVSPGFRLHLLGGAFLLMLGFWGYSSDGLGRNCLEPLAVFLIIYTAVAIRTEWPGWPWLLLFTSFEAASVRVIGVVGASSFSVSELRFETSTLLFLSLAGTLIPSVWFLLRYNQPESSATVLSAANAVC